jgi:hypothetical protein
VLGLGVGFGVSHEGCILSDQQQENDKQSRSWLVPFAAGLIAGVLITLSAGEWLREQAEESSTVANAALEAGPAQPAPPRAPEPPVAPTVREPAPSEQPPSAAAPAAQEAPPAREPEPAAPPPPAAAAPSTPAAAPPAVGDTKLAAVPASKAPAPAAPAPQPTAAPQAPVAKPAAPPPAAAPAIPQDPNSEDAMLAAAAQVKVKGDTKIDNMLDQALTGEKRPQPAAAPPSAPALAQTPSRDDVVNAMSMLVPAIRGCAQGQSGLAPMSIVVLSDGRVESAALSSGPFQGTASGRCMEGVVRRARFPHFKQANFRVQFPFSVQ